MLRAVSLLLLCLGFAACSSVPPPRVESVVILEISPEFMQASDFKRINEFLSGVEEQGNRTVVRSQSDDRRGFYFTLRLDHRVDRLQKGTRIIAEIFTPTQTELQRFDLALPAKRGKSRELLFGLTGTDWPFEDERVPAAWRFTLQDPNGKTLGSAQSYLWN
ncbi:MAG: hypothetical protein GWO81_06870 [Verrucomicrobia bacterium]|nr:hypothetical protein [Verrucomicrobiota bacterium]